ncbi:MAG: hypothetical protein LLG20_04070 [Acidobacteriales bacterium]|nr:hypothetical protein [Terriglobales bacterium]
MKNALVLRQTVAVGALACLISTQAPAEELRLHWNELAPVVTGKKVWMPVGGKAKIVGTVEAVEPASLRVQVTKTSDRKAYPKGLVSIPRSEISSIQVNKPAGHKGLIIGTVAGIGIAAAAGATIGAISRNEGTSDPPVLAAAIAGPIAIGLAVGWLIDKAAHRGGKRVTLIAD